LFDEVQPLLDQFLNLMEAMRLYDRSYMGPKTYVSGRYGPYAVPEFDKEVIERLRKTDGYATCPKWERLLASLKLGVAEVSADLEKQSAKSKPRPRDMTDSEWRASLKQEISQLFSLPGRKQLCSTDFKVAMSVSGQWNEKRFGPNDPDRWTTHALSACLTALKGQ
jgi:hypothetical protein